MYKRVVLLILPVVLLGLFAVHLRAVLLTGTLNGSGSVTITNAGATFSAFQVDSSSSGGFVSIGGTSATIQALTQLPGSALAVPNWITFSAVPNITVTLTQVNNGLYGAAGCGVAPASGQSCTPVGTAFNFTNITLTSSIVSFVIQGTQVDSLTGATQPITGVFTAQFPDKSYQSVLATLAGSGSLSTTFSASFK